MFDNLVCRKCGSREVAQKPIEGLPGALRSYCPDCGSEAGYIPIERFREEKEPKSFWQKLIKALKDEI